MAHNTKFPLPFILKTACQIPYMTGHRSLHMDVITDADLMAAWKVQSGGTRSSGCPLSRGAQLIVSCITLPRGSSNTDVRPDVPDIRQRQRQPMRIDHVAEDPNLFVEELHDLGVALIHRVCQGNRKDKMDCWTGRYGMRQRKYACTSGNICRTGAAGLNTPQGNAASRDVPLTTSHLSNHHQELMT